MSVRDSSGNDGLGQGMAGAPRLYRFLHGALPSIMDRMFSMQAEGVENVPAEGGAILACNHLSFVDSLALPVNIDRPLYFLGKADYWDSWKTRWFFKSTGVIPVDRAGGDKSAGALTTGTRILEAGELLGIYPEGTRSPDGRLYRGKTGPARIAITARVPIIPCATIGTDGAWPSGSRLPRRHPVIVRYGKPLDFSRYYGKADDPVALRAATDELMFEIMMLSGQQYVDEYAAKIKKGEIDLRDRPDTTIQLDESAPADESRQAS